MIIAGFFCPSPGQMNQLVVDVRTLDFGPDFGPKSGPPIFFFPLEIDTHQANNFHLSQINSFYVRKSFFLMCTPKNFSLIPSNSQFPMVGKFLSDSNL